MSAPPSQSPIELFQELRDLVIEEAHYARSGYERLLHSPITDRVLQGKCLEEVRFQRKLQSGVLRFECSENQSEYREGDFVILHTGNPFESTVTAQWVNDGIHANGKEFIDLAMSDGCIDAIHKGKGIYTLDLGFFDLSPQLLRALDEMGASERGRSRILPLFQRETEVEGVDPYEYEDAASHASEEGFNAAQEEAVGVGSSCDWCALIQGPPGTGKTRVLAQIVRERLKRGERILVSACTHRAIDEALSKVNALNPDCECIAKVGAVGTQLLGTVPHHENFSDCNFETSTEGYVIGATPYCAFSERLKTAEFDCVIIDEASQMTLPLAVMAMLSADTFVVIGDEKQLPPVVLSTSAMQAKHYGLFQRLGSVAEREMLDTSYRMNTEICDWVSSEFYLSELEASEQSCDKTLQLSGQSSQPWLSQALSSEKSLVWIPTQAKTTRHYSMEEADLVNQLLQELHRRGHPIADVGIITPFRRQARVIRNRLQQNRCWDASELQQVVIDTVERMQGQERSVIILSTAAADTGFLTAIQEFIYLPARLNVIVSRAKVKVIILATDRFIEIEGSDDEVREAIEHWRSLRDSSHLIEI